MTFACYLVSRPLHNKCQTLQAEQNYGVTKMCLMHLESEELALHCGTITVHTVQYCLNNVTHHLLFKRFKDQWK